MDVVSFSSDALAVEKLMVSSFVEAVLIDTLLAAQRSLVYFLMLAKAVLNDGDVLPNLIGADQRFPKHELHRRNRPEPENKDGSDTDDVNEDADDANQDDDDDAGDEDFSGEEGQEDDEGDLDEDPAANGNGGSDDEDDDDDGDEDEDGDEEDEDEDGDEEDEDEEEEDEDEDEQPPAKKRVKK